ncbi:MAG TPA: hypothetical protein VL092_12585 [Chitinophagaceae bacterium]|nr:hypothetical protein [Chitinophagaceae bacterium]
MATYADSFESFIPTSVQGLLPQPEVFPFVSPVRSRESLLSDLLRCTLEQRLQLIENLLCSESK